MFKDYENVDTTKAFIHVMGWCMAPQEASTFIPHLCKKLNQFYEKTAFLCIPTKPSKFTGHVGTNIFLTCDPTIHKEVLAAVNNIQW